VSVGYGTNDPTQPMSLHQARSYWYHWYMATPRGERTVRKDRKAFARIMWDTWSPPGWVSDDEFDATAAAFDNDDWPGVTLHSYRHRWGHAPGDAAYAADDATLNPAPVLDVPTLVLHGASDFVNRPDSSAGKERFFTGPYRRVLLDGVGHFPPREAPQAVARELLGFLAG
jgi:pimeloyl-ACP methyl ester carboxylesterase